MRILITGGAGFIGSNLCDKLLQEGHEVLCMDNLSTGNKKNIENLLRNEGFSFIKHDIINKIEISGPIDQIYNLACPASPPKYQADPIQTAKTNFIGMLNVLEFAEAKGARVLQTSTSEVYGDPEIHPQTEDYRGNVNTLGIRACYDEGKRIAETLCMDFHRQKGVDIRIVRIFNTYGPNMDIEDGRMVSNFIARALSSKPLEIYGNGSQTRSLLYVDDQVDGLTKMMNQNNFIGPVNIGSQNEMTVQEVAETILKLIGSDSEIVYKDLPEDDPKLRRPDTSLAEEKLKWAPKVSTEDGLKKTIEWFKSKTTNSAIPKLPFRQ